ncbi:MAG: type VI secretion system baseplate subunit TssK [Thalassolituus sp.]|jgi:type VI secretion system protein ImpJ|uniref:type VI secretion system baseplate subunit TssK n=1 Tax=unclassified Thalassolituus TaxID=2624967 RepID=UPI000C0D164B|nr:MULTISPECIES: type VI secretion system baseplate subunit TssK [unclassified Thalassolituus]MBN59452.1 type VI secretion system baseplate subunit TssK [Oceanospirillaceae bacterium]MDQ4422687.1 type VI secretion system baseplate subunit TssK [Thalassolituus sp.]MDQ4425474.1 type VI secretion system baseplate subunit TssK [Thalassolituus sp.]|tara:strand:- start:17592 stop:18926 length:1335 start_codon:yes stop_codon:yes gene_type:complete
MSSKNKVIWSEGMFLRPQHFQQQDRFVERLVDVRTGAVGSYYWGIQELTIDVEALELGKVSISSVRGIFPDGTPILAPESEELPPIIEIPENTRDEIVYLCVPMRRPGAQESVRDAEEFPQARFQTYNFDARDSSSASGQSARIQIGKLSTCFKLGSEDLGGYACIGIARIAERLPGNPVKLDKTFIPPVLDCTVSGEIKGYIEEVSGLLRQRGEALSHRLSDSGRSGSAEIADYLLLQVINRVQPLVKHLTQLATLHPLTLYTELLQLAGELSTFTASDKRPPEMPPYIHTDLQQTFAGLFSALRQSLSMVLEQSAISLDLVERKYGIHVAPITDPSLTRSASFVVAVKADMPTEVLRSRFPAQAKIAPVETIRELITTQLPGLRTRPLPVAPRQIPYHAGFTYFEIENTGDLWKSMQQSGGFAVHLGADYPGLIMELWAIRS